MMKKYIVVIFAVLLATTAIAHSSRECGSFSSGSRGGGFSSRGYSGSSRSFSSPRYVAPSRSFRSPSYTPPRYVAPIRSYTPTYGYRTPGTVYRAPIVEHHYYGGYGLGGSILHNPFFWMWAMQSPHQSYYSPGMMMPNGVVAGPGGGYYAAPMQSFSILDSIIMWIIVLGVLFMLGVLVVVIWRAIRDY